MIQYRGDYFPSMFLLKLDAKQTYSYFEIHLKHLTGR